MATVNIKSISKSYGEHRILHEISLNIEKGEFVAVVGPSGCGKSTLLRLVAGLEPVSGGSILINNRCVNQLPPAARDMAMVFQSYALYPHMTVYDNMAYGLKMRGMEKSLIRPRVEEVAKLLQLSDLLQRKPGLLSGGQRQRVAMGRAMVRKPAVFLFDEPLSNLDAKLRTEMRHEIKKIHQKLNTTCLYVTHDQTEAMTLADRVVILNNGLIEQIGTPQAIYQLPATQFVASFIGHYPMNFLPATINLKQQNLLTCTGNTLPLLSSNYPVASGDAVLVGIRPEHLQITADEGQAHLSGTIELIDDMGADKLIQFMPDRGGARLSVRVPGDVLFTGRRCSVAVDMSKVNIFCIKTGALLQPTSEGDSCA